MPQAAAEEKLQAIIEQAEANVSFDTSRLGSLTETILQEELTGMPIRCTLFPFMSNFSWPLPATRVTPLAFTPGRVLLTDKCLYFQV